MRARLACHQCRIGKKRCHCTAAGEACLRCLQAGAQCSYTHKPQPQHRLRPSQNLLVSRPVSVPIVCLPHKVAQELVEHYIHYIHDRPHSLFHHPTLRRQAATNTINPCILYAICSFGSRFHKDPDIASLGPQLTAEAKRLLNCEIENASLETVQACALIGHLCASELNSKSDAIYCGLATRLALITGINDKEDSDSIILSEVKLRVWCTLYMSDRWCSTRHGLPRMISDFELPNHLPMSEYIFHSLNGSEELGPRNWKPGLWAYMITLVRAFGPIQDLNHRLANGGVVEDDVDSHVEKLSQQLDLWVKTLPLDLQMTQSNLDAHIRNGLGGPFIALHLGYHHYSTLLYFQFLESQASASHKLYADRCKAHSSGCSSLLASARQLEGCEAVYSTVGQMAMVSSAVLLHTLLFGDETELPRARSSLSSNFETLMKLKRYWPVSIGETIKRLFMFQNICLASTNAHSTYKIDRWMVRFLLENALPLRDKMTVDPRWPGQTEPENMSLCSQRFSERGRMMDNALSELLT